MIIYDNIISIYHEVLVDSQTKISVLILNQAKGKHFEINTGIRYIC